MPNVNDAALSQRFYGSLMVLDNDGSLGDLGMFDDLNTMLPVPVRARQNKDLGPGDEGKKVLKLQEDLIAAGYTLAKTSKYDDDTMSSVQDLQYANKLPATGTFDKNTEKALKATLKGSSSSSGGSNFAVGLLKGFTGMVMPKSAEAPLPDDTGTGGSGEETSVGMPSWVLWVGVGLGAVVVMGGMLYFVTKE